MRPDNKCLAITTPIYYVNAEPHLGHTYTTLVADAFARFYRQRGYKVLFATGTDEHGAKIAQAAREQKLTEKAYVDKMAASWKKAWELLDVSFTDFIRTTSPRHVHLVQEVLKKMLAQGTIYEGVYEGWYCLPCETFHKESEVTENKHCPNEWCLRPLERVQEKGFYFKLSAFAQPLLEHYKKHPEAVLPDFRYNEVVSFIQQELKDVYMTRSTFSWGIPLPFAPQLVTYVWFDALLNYLTVTGYLSQPELFQKYWPVEVHFVAKDILRFHAVIWPAMLMALKLPLPKHIFAHGFWKIGEAKMSKSKGGVVTPSELISWLEERYYKTGDTSQGQEKRETFALLSDVLRFYLFFEVPLGQDGSFSYESLAARYENHLANDLGNLIQRTGKMLWQYEKGEKPGAPLSQEMEKMLFASSQNLERAMENYDLHGAVRSWLSLCAFLNQYIEKEKPWALYKENREKGKAVLSNLLKGVKALTFFIFPFMPHVAKKIEELFGWKLQPTKDLKEALESKEQEMKKEFSPLFPKPRKEKASFSSPLEQKKEEITYEDFAKLDLRVAKIKEAQVLPGADKLFKLKLEVGGEEVQVVAGLRPHYALHELDGKTVILVKNLRAARIRGEISQGMLLAADLEGKPILLVPEKEVPSGTKVR